MNVQSNSRQHGLYRWAVPATLLASAAVGLICRFVWLRGSYWFDEAFVAELTTLSWSDVWYVFRSEEKILYLLSAKVWAGWFGNGEVALRLLSVMFGTFAVLSAAWVAWKLRGKVAGLAALTLTSASAFLMFYAREARMYSLLALLSVWSIYVFWTWLQAPTWGRGVALALVNVAAFLTHPTALELFIVQAVFFVIDRNQHRIPWRRAWGVIGIMGAVLVPWSIYNIIPRTLSFFQQPIWLNQINLDRWGISEVFHSFILFDSVRHPFGSNQQIEVFFILRPLIWLIMIGLLVAPFLHFIRRWRELKSNPHGRLLVYLGLMVIVPLMLGFAARVAIPKYFFPSAIACYLLAAIGFQALYYRFLPFAALTAAGLFLFSVTNLPVVAFGQTFQYPLSRVAQYVERHAQTGDVVLIHPWLDDITFDRYYDHQTVPVQRLLPEPLPPESRVPFIHYSKYSVYQVITPDNIGWLEEVTAPYSRIWLIDNNQDEFWNSRLVRQWLLDHGWAISGEPDVQAPDRVLTLFVRLP